MPVTMQDVRAALDPEEPDYVEAARLGAEALPHLEVLIRDEWPLLASKATYLASLVGGREADRILLEAARSSRAVVRVAAAAGARNLPAPDASDLLLVLLDDDDAGVRRKALKVASPGVRPEVLRKIEALATEDPDAGLRALSSEALQRLVPFGG